MQNEKERSVLMNAGRFEVMTSSLSDGAIHSFDRFNPNELKTLCDEFLKTNTIDTLVTIHSKFDEKIYRNHSSSAQ